MNEKRFDDWSESALPGQRKLAVGDVVDVLGGEHICVVANASNAVVRSLGRPAGKVVTLGGKDVEFQTRRGEHRVSTQLDRGLFVRRATPEEEDKFLGDYPLTTSNHRFSLCISMLQTIVK